FRNAADLYLYPNTLVVVKASGKEVKEWLECSAGQFNQIDIHSIMKLKGRFGECKAESLAQDFINVTCLIQREGFNKYIFIHKSIQ
ncbi:hypothetical protein MJN85_28510, partial [Salmonella enterica subsp. enterica serovar Anatum]|nr:hypothetical protein [Salmonella enterica subsp. enterica serovar Anatum]